EEKFRFYMCQDYAFLIEYCRVLALAAAKARELPDMSWFARLLDATLNTEMALHRSYAARFGISEAELEGAELAPSARAYTRHLLSVAWGGELGEIAAALLPCQWSYSEIGQKLASRGEPQGPYAEWVRAYASEEFAELANWIRELVNRLAEEAAPSARRLWEEHFRASCRYEHLFWEMSWKMEGWGV
ncbi:MAG: thiaminase II, partial [Nitrospinota bacterium]